MTSNFLDTIRDLRGGGAINDLDEALRALVLAVATTGKRGEIRLTVQVRPAGKGSADVLLVEDRIDTKTPKHDRPAWIVYPLPDGTVTRTDPRQPELSGLRELAPVLRRDPEDDSQPAWREGPR